MSLLYALRRLGVLRTLDDALAQAMRRLDPDATEEVLVAGALASFAVAQGHAGFDPAQPRRLVDADLAWPAPDAWRAALAASPLVAVPRSAADASAAAPLVLEDGLVYLRRYREHERHLALGLARIAAQSVAMPDLDRLAPLFATLFPDAADDRQARAAALALRRALLLVTGGPGTGKTTTIARLLALRVAAALHAGRAPPRIALAAPTGRAAERMAESLRHAVARMAAVGVPAGVRDALPSGAGTLHRLLGTIPDRPDFRHGADNPLPHDVVVVDEASMVDLPLMRRLVEAIGPGTQLILLGDPDQLPSVEAGDVLAAIVRAAGSGDGLCADDAHALAPLLGRVAAAQGDGALASHRVHLERGWRQGDALHLAPLADAVRRGGDAAAREHAIELLRGGTLAGVSFRSGAFDPSRDAPRLLAHWRALARMDDPAEALREAGRMRLLSAVREGPQGTRRLNERIAAQLAGQRIGAQPAWFPGRLVLITENSYRHGLFNGDTGICLPDASGTLTAWFPGDDPAHPRAFHPAALPAHESAFAMTVHKAQGSEFDAVWLVLPTRPNRVLSRELLYTGLTRARSELHVVAEEGILREALSRHASRMSGLARRLGARSSGADG